MKAAITVWGDRVSPVFDSAQTILIAEIENGRVTGKRYEPFDPDLPHQLTDRLAKSNVEVLLCGAISTIPSNTIELSGVRLISFISGNVDEILQAYARGKSLIPEYVMPGCRCRYQNQRKRGGGHGKEASCRQNQGFRSTGIRNGKKGQGTVSDGRQRKQQANRNNTGKCEWKQGNQDGLGSGKRRGTKHPGG